MLTEHQIQVMIFHWAEKVKAVYPELEFMFAIPNGGLRHIAVAVKLKKEGVKSGVPDIFLPCMRGDYGGLFIELKAEKGKPSKAQVLWKKVLEKAGYKVEICYGFNGARAVIEEYINSDI